jgi:hypothetical protein
VLTEEVDYVLSDPDPDFDLDPDPDPDPDPGPDPDLDPGPDPNPNQVDYVISDQLRGKYGFDVLLVTSGMIASILGSLILTAGMANQQP